MNPSVITGPALEPVSLAEAKEHLKIDHSDEDAYITSLITAARKFSEAYTGILFIEQNLKWTLDRWPGYGGTYQETLPLISNYGKNRFIEVPKGPLLAVTSITTFDDDDGSAVWGPENYYVSAAQNRIYRRTGVAWPNPGRAGDGIEIIYQAGFGPLASDVPATLRHALLLIIGHLYSNREPVKEVAALNVPFTIREQLGLFKRISL